MALTFKDGVPENVHPLNVVEEDRRDTVEDGTEDISDVTLEAVGRPPLFEVYMRMAEELAKRSTCARLRVGTVITDACLEHVVAIGYNGNVRGFPNQCDSDKAGKCGCIHSEMNALVKSPGHLRDKVAFITASPCVMCAKLIIQANISHVFFRERYRDPAGLDILETAGVVAVHYTRWENTWRE
ncbi:deaminase [Gemmatimonadales bacterium]|nr:deaminase [Gemmatimonadales bacterium]